MKRDKLKQELQKIYYEVFDDTSIVLFNEMTADDIEAWDSLTHLRLIMQIEQYFNIKFTTAQIKRTKNVGMLIDMIEQKIVK